MLVKDDEREQFGESIADDCGCQDYSYKVSYKKVGEFWLEDLQELKRILNENSDI